MAHAPRDIALLLDTGRALAKCGEWGQARPLLERVVAAGRAGDWRTGWALVELAEIEYGLGEEPVARVHAGTALAQAATANIVSEVRRFSLLTGDAPAYRDWALVETGALRFHFAPGMSAAERQRYAEARERVLLENQAFFSAKLPKRIDFFVWPDADAGKRAGLDRVGFAVPGWCVIHVRAEQTPGHEISHVLHYHAFHPVQGTGLIGEGVAVLFDGQVGVDRMAIAREAVGQAGLKTLSIVALWQTWPEADDGAAYPVAGAFVELLRRRGGDARLRRLLAVPGYSAARRLYGAELDGWISEFETALFVP